MKYVIFKRKWTILSLILIVPLGLFTKIYSGPLVNWVKNSAGGIFYVIFWALMFYLFLPKMKPIWIALTVLIITCCLEFLQLWHPYFLELLRSNFIGRTILGTTFSWNDFIYYIIGFIVSGFLLSYLSKLERIRDPKV